MVVLGDFIDKGTFGSIYKTTVNRKTYCLKEFPLAKGLKAFLHESEMGFLTKNKINHSVTVYKSFVQEGNGYILMDYIPGGNLLSLFTEGTPFTEQFAASIFYKICVAVKELHDLGIAHLDLKLENILVEEENDELVVKLCDFGSSLCCDLNDSHPFVGRFGSRFYLAPEIMKKQEFYPGKADSWSLGMILHVLLVKCFPVYNQYEEFSLENFTYDFLHSRNLSIHAKNLVRSLLCLEACNRPSLDDILSHPFIAFHSPMPSRMKSASFLSKLKKKRMS